MAVFLGEDGTLSMGNKTPVTILQETLQKQGVTPHYDLIYNGTGSLDPVFKFQVSALGLTAIGDGKTKKEAKHDAAAALLMRMQVNKGVTKSAEVSGSDDGNIASPYAGALKQNYVGMLDEVCFFNQLPFPAFIPVKEAGPPHARVFTIQCKVGNLSETAVARTKKQAKHLSSQQMIKKLTKVLGTNFNPIPEKTCEEDDDSAQNAIPEAESFKIDHETPFSKMGNVFFSRTEENPLPGTFKELPSQPLDYFEKLENPKLFLDNLVKDLNGMSRVVYLERQELRDTVQEVNKLYKEFLKDEVSNEEDQLNEPPEDDVSSKEKKVFEMFDLDDDDEKPLETSSATTHTPLRSAPIHEPLTSTPTHEPLTSAPTHEPLASAPTHEPLTSGPTHEPLASAPTHEPLTSAPTHEPLNKTLSDTELESRMKNLDLDGSGLSRNDSSVVLVLLEITCPQGFWVFRGTVKTSIEQAINQAARNALVFLRIMSVPSGTKYEKSS